MLQTLHRKRFATITWKPIVPIGGNVAGTIMMTEGDQLDEDEDLIDLDVIGTSSIILDMEKDLEDILSNVASLNVSYSCIHLSVSGDR